LTQPENRPSRMAIAYTTKLVREAELIRGRTAG